MALLRVRVSRGSEDVQVAQSQAMTGMPADVPVPRNRISMGDCRLGWVVGDEKIDSTELSIWGLGSLLGL